MTIIKRAGQSGALNVTPSNEQFREQIAALVDAMRQLGGNARIVSGALAQADPLNGPFTLYVDPIRGSDRFVGGSYNSHEAGATDEEIIAQKLKRISLQQLECGYTEARPFKTINRAAIEAAIITSRSWYTYTDPRAHVDCVSIVLEPAVHILYNDPGSASTSLASWGDTKDPTIAELINFNPVTVGGVLLPRGCSLCSPDLRKTTIRPNWVPAIANEAADYSNRRAMLKVTGTGYFFGHTFMDKVGLKESHHLLDPYGPASKVELDAFYAKCLSAVGTGADLSSALTVTRPTEYEIVGPIDITQSPTSQWDTTASASPYIFNCSVRSDYGLGGAFWDGSKVGGLKSMVCANFTGVSLQKDMRCWQVYEGGNWVNLANTPQDYQKYINASPDDVRMNPARLSRHITAINDAFIQEVSVFAIGHGIHHFTDRGGEITVTNSNSSFGGCAALSTGYKSFAFPQDRNWTVGRIRVPLNLGEKTGNVRRVFLGTISAISANKITLTVPLAADETSATVPAILLRDGYSLASGTKVWVENPTGDDWRTDLTSSAWSSSAADEVNISAALTQAGTNDPVGTNPDTGASFAIGKRVYIRRLVDTRSPSEKRLSLQLNNTASARLPERNFVLQTDPARVGGAISRVLAAGGSEVLVVTRTGAGPAPGSGVAKTSEVTIRRGSPSVNYANSTFYRAGTIVKFANKHFQSLRDQTTTSASPSPLTWGETFVHMPSGYNAEDPLRNESPFLVIDTDTDPAADTQTCGINFTTAWTSAGPIRDQYRSATDYLGAHAFLVALGFTAAAAHTALLPQVAANRDRNPASSTQFPTAPSGGAANGLGNWAVEFRRYSALRLYGHAWEWAGYLNYSKSIPAAQKDLGPQNKFTYYFTSAEGGRVVPQGSNEDGFNVTPRGLEDIETGATLSVDAIGNSTLDDFQRTDFPNGLTASEITVDSLTINTSVQFPEVSAAKINALGPVRLASIAQLTALGGNAPVASTNAALEAAPEAVTIGGLNRWRQANRLISAATGAITIYVQSSAPDRNLDAMFDTPPTSTANPIPTLARAAEYANAVIGSGNQTAEVRIAPGLYDPASVWECNVVFRASDPTQAGWPLIFTETGPAETSENFFDGSGYGNLSTRVNFRTFVLELRDNESAGNQLHVNTIGRQIRCRRGVDFRGGFHFLGVPELIKLVADGAITAGQFISGSVALPSGAFTTNTATNVDTFLNQLRISNGRNPIYDSWTATAPIRLEGNTTDVADLRSIVFGPALPSHKESLGATRDPYIATNGLVQLRLSNLYLRGNVTVTSAGAGVTNAVPLSGEAHYGSASVAAPWTWRQFHHTFLGPITNEPVVIDRMGGRQSYLQSGVFSRSWYKNAAGTRYLVNHIHLLTSAGAEPADNDSGPFLDQFIHAKRSLIVRESFLTPFSVASTGAVSQGFVGRFGSNGYNTVKTRGVLLGNEGLRDQERGATVLLGVDARLALPGADNTALSIFGVAGLERTQTTQILPKYDIGTATFGEPNPVGAVDRKYNPVITTAALNQADGTFFLNMALRSYARGISPEHGFSITPNVVL